ncbi:acylneuraminate cytidylyltransferase family protein [Microbulbifer sediminum]|uniref:acylneuraminate cytidylyltransferase family protein n=1 Tax=Microbulbifer sediminum TaxID=2904250 RepID=UPI001F2CC163|nr:acylneuraminate cytidylyltransferase family protein [Microbulbifer sediminum]
MLALIPARGGSKGLPKKNILPIGGKPLIGHSIAAAKLVEQISEVYVSTDCEEIADVARGYGAIVPFMRSEALASDTAVAIDVYLDFIQRMESRLGKELNEIVVLLPTCPLRTSLDIESAITLFREKNADSVISYTQESHPIRWHKYVNDEGKFENIFNEVMDNRQTEKVSYYPNGAIYIFKTDLLKNRKYYSENSYAYLMPRSRSVDIDYQDDLDYARYLMEAAPDA